jgi:hypothetical protein
MWLGMKITPLSLLVIFAGIIITSACVDAGDNALSSKAGENLYRNIFHPYTGLLNHRGTEISDPGIQEVHPHYSSNGQGYKRVHNLSNATMLLDRNIEKAEVISARLEEGIQHYKAEGKDVRKLETLLQKYNQFVEDAKKYRALADSSVAEEKNSSITDLDLENYSSENTRREYLIRSQKSMIQASIVLKEIFNEFQRLMPGSEEINKTSRFSAAGDGRASLIGNFTLNLHLERGDVAIIDLSPDSEINITGDYVFEQKTDMQENVLNIYHIFFADMEISGSRKTVLLRGSNITLTAASGEGYVLFQGDGTYRIEETDGTIKEQSWANPFPKTNKSRE